MYKKLSLAGFSTNGQNTEHLLKTHVHVQMIKTNVIKHN